MSLRTAQRLCALVLFLSIISTFGVKKHFRKDFVGGGQQETSVTLFESFGLGVGAEVHFSYSLSNPNQAVFFLLLNERHWDEIYRRVLDQQETLGPFLCGCPSVARVEAQGNGNFSIQVQKMDQYTLQLAHCSSAEFHIEGDLWALNLGQGGTLDHHLPIELVNIIPLYGVGFVVYALLLALWAHECWTQQAAVLPVQLYGSAALVSKVLEAALALSYAIALDSSGNVSTSFTVVKNLVAAASSVVFLLLMLATALGWSIVRRRLTRKELRTISASFGLLVFLSVVRVLCYRERDLASYQGNNSSCSPFLLSEYVLKSLLMLAVIVAVNFNITQMRGSIHEQSWAPGTPRNYAVLQSYQMFRWAFLAYLLLPTALLIVKLTVLSWEHQWVDAMLYEVFLLLIYVHIGLTFRPAKAAGFTQLRHFSNLAGVAPPAPAPPAQAAGSGMFGGAGGRFGNAVAVHGVGAGGAAAPGGVVLPAGAGGGASGERQQQRGGGGGGSGEGAANVGGGGDGNNTERVDELLLEMRHLQEQVSTMSQRLAMLQRDRQQHQEGEPRQEQQGD